MKIRVPADHAGATIREAAWGLEERVLWKGSDATRSALDRAGRSLQPLQRLIQVKLTWPLGDAFRARGRATRTVLCASAAALAVAAATAGGITGAGQSSTDQSAAPLPPPASVTPAPAGGDGVVLQGVTPQFQAGHAPPPPPTPPTTKPSAPAAPEAAPADVAWQFAQAFVGYEIGHSNKKTNAAFEATATKQLVKALAADPPRLPANGKVPRARVLNVVLGSGTKTQVTASVSLVRLRAISELRLTLTRSGANWRVAQVLG